MNGTPNEFVKSRRFSAVSMISFSLSITHGPAMRKSGRCCPTSKLSKCMAMSVSGGGDGLRVLGERRFHRRIGERGFDEAAKQRMSVARRRCEFRVKLARDEPRMVRQFDHLDQTVVR